MLLKLLAPLRTDFAIVTERPMLEPYEYAHFWDSIEKTLLSLRNTMPHADDWSSEMKEVQIAHLSKYHKALGGGSAYRTLDNDSLPRPLHIMEVQLRAQHIHLDITGEMEQYLLSLLNRVLIRIYDQHISLVEMDIPLQDTIAQIAPEDLTQHLDNLGDAAVTLGEMLSRWCNEHILTPLFTWLQHQSSAETYIDMTPSPIVDDEVMWVTRTLIFERDDSSNRNAMIEHWLKDSGGHDVIGDTDEIDTADTLTYIENAQRRSDAHVARWLNYLFREDAYPHPSPQALSTEALMPPFCDAWNGLLYAQYYYAALDVVDRHLTSILASAWVPARTIKVNSLKELLEYNIRNANLLLLQRQDNNKYYRRTVKAELENILNYWEFEDVLVDPVKRKIDLCESRLTLLLQQEASKSAIFTDMILLGIGITGIFSTFLALAEFGRTMATDVNLASYDVNSPNLIEWLAVQPTDVILVLSLMLSAILAIFYLFFRQRQMVS